MKKAIMTLLLIGGIAVIVYLLFYKVPGGEQCAEDASCAASASTVTPGRLSSPSLSPVGALAGQFYYVSASGDDANPGFATAPFRTIGRAASVATAGDTVLIHSGTYYEDVKPLNSGTPGQYITYKSYGDGEVIIDA